MNFTVNLVGAGNMGGAMLRGWIAGGLAPSRVTVIDPSPNAEMADWLNSESIRQVPAGADAERADVLLLAVKPQMMTAVLPGVAGLCDEDVLAVSVAAGTTIAAISAVLGKAKVVRCMPNTPSLVGRGMTVACPGPGVTDVQKAHVTSLLTAIGKLEWVDDEQLIDAVTAVSGSGPAYVFHLAECMEMAGEKAGLPRELAITLARETVAGAGELLFRSPEDAGQLRRNVTSPGGTTQAALEVFMDGDALAKLVQTAVAAAAKRSRELS